MKRNLFAELKQGLKEVKVERQGKLSLRKVEVESLDTVDVPAEEIKAAGEACSGSQAVAGTSTLPCTQPSRLASGTALSNPAKSCLMQHARSF
jgi:hypothetical protein